MLCGSELIVYWCVLAAVVLIAVLLAVFVAVYYSGLKKLKNSLFEGDCEAALKAAKSLKARTFLPLSRASSSIMISVLMHRLGDRDGSLNALCAVKNKKSAFAKHYWLTVFSLIDGDIESARAHYDDFRASRTDSEICAEYDERLKIMFAYKEEGTGESELKKIIEGLKQSNPIFADTLAELIEKKEAVGGKEKENG